MPIPQQAPRSFYRRPLPSSCIALSSKEGQELFCSAMSKGGTRSFFPLVENYLTQSEPAFCGVSTLVMILNALAVDPHMTWKGPWRWYEERMLNCCVDMEKVKQTGITIPQFVCLAQCQGLTATCHYGSDTSLETFRNVVKEACCCTPAPHHPEDDSPDKHPRHHHHHHHHHEEIQNMQFLVVSYCRKVLGQTGSGHFSPLAAYDPASDRVLILDTARFKYGPHWVDLKLLYEALMPLDGATGRSRGGVLLRHEATYGWFEKLCDKSGLNDGTDGMVPPPSALFQSRMKHFPVRCRYKLFLDQRNATNEDAPLTFEEVIQFWTKHGTNVDFVWEMLDPQLVPRDTAERNMLGKMLKMIDTLVRLELGDDDDRLGLIHRDHDRSKSENTRDGKQVIDIGPLGAMFVIFLSSLEPCARKEMVVKGTLPEVKQNATVDTGEGDDSSSSADDANLTERAHAQLLAEADLIHLAVQFSTDCAACKFGNGECSSCK